MHEIICTAKQKPGRHTYVRIHLRCITPRHVRIIMYKMEVLLGIMLKPSLRKFKGVTERTCKLRAQLAETLIDLFELPPQACPLQLAQLPAEIRQHKKRQHTQTLAKDTANHCYD